MLLLLLALLLPLVAAAAAVTATRVIGLSAAHRAERNRPLSTPEHCFRSGVSLVWRSRAFLSALLLTYLCVSEPWIVHRDRARCSPDGGRPAFTCFLPLNYFCGGARLPHYPPPPLPPPSLCTRLPVPHVLYA